VIFDARDIGTEQPRSRLRVEHVLEPAPAIAHAAPFAKSETAARRVVDDAEPATIPPVDAIACTAEIQGAAVREYASHRTATAARTKPVLELNEARAVLADHRDECTCALAQ